MVFRLKSSRVSKFFLLLVTFFCSSIWSLNSFALDLDWGGQFRAETHWVLNYTLDSSNLTNDPTKLAGEGYYIPGGGNNNAAFHSLFMKLQPSIIVNDNVYIKSEWWVGDPVFGLFGNGAPYTVDQRNFFSTQSRGSTITAQRYWAEILTDIGTVQIGRAPFHWGLGVLWNSGDDLDSRYHSTGDTIRLVSKFGSFTFSPSFIKYSIGNNIGGSCPDPTGTTPCATTEGGGHVTDYSLIFQYENLDEDFELGLNFIRRLGGGAQDSTFGFFGVNGAVADYNYNVWDIYGKKRIGPVTIAGEVPITSGQIGGVNYSAFAVALEGTVKLSDAWQIGAKAGHAPGQPNLATGATPGSFDAFFFNPGYNLGLIMFNYQLRNFAGPNTLNNPNTPQSNLLSPYDHSIVNTNYLAATGSFQTNKWNFHTTWVFAKALESASSGTQFYNYWLKKFVDFNGSFGQGTSYGWEMDYGATLQWDENFRFDFDFGWWFPGDFYAFANAATDNQTSSVFATVLRAGVSF